MRMLHTSDWHLGASLEEVSREADHRQFLDWLAALVDSEKIEVLLVAGDIFDNQTPSAEAQGLYYRFLHRLQGTGLRQVVVVGGNHDSPSRLDAPRELLGACGVHVVGGINGQEDLDRCLCPILGAGGAVEAVVVAVPFVNEWRLGFRLGEGDEAERQEQLGAPFKALYADLADRAEAAWPGVPLVATGHLAVMGSGKDDAPLEIHLIGSLGGLPTGIFDPRFAYVALGHIHKNYAVAGTQARYSGTPFALNFKEGKTPRRVNRVDLGADGSVTVEVLTVPLTRQVLEVSGSLDQVKGELERLRWCEPLPPMVKAEVRVEAPRPGVEEEIRAFCQALDPAPTLVGVRQTLVRATAEGGPPEPVHRRLDELTPREVFRMLCAARGENHEELRDAFEALLAGEGAE